MREANAVRALCVRVLRVVLHFHLIKYRYSNVNLRWNRACPSKITNARSHTDTETNSSSASTCAGCAFTAKSLDPVAYAPCQHLAILL